MNQQAANRPRAVLVYMFDLRTHAQIQARSESQREVFRSRGLDASAISMSRGASGNSHSSTQFLPAYSPRQLRAFFEARMLGRVLAVRAPDVVVVRYGFATRSLLQIARRHPTVLEIHADDTRELPPRLSTRLFAKLSNRIYRQRLFRAVRGAMFVSSDLERLEAFQLIRGPRAVIPNGIRVPAEPLPAPTNPRPVVGYSVGYAAPWQGLDRLSALADLLPEFDFQLVVPDARFAEEVAGSVVRVAVAADPEMYRQLIAGFDVALGGLAVDRKGIDVASALKVRESVSLGIPTLLFSRDEDLEMIDAPTISTIARGAWEPSALAGDVRSFVRRAIGARVPDDLRRLVDIEVKAADYARLLLDVVQVSRVV